RVDVSALDDEIAVAAPFADGAVRRAHFALDPLGVHQSALDASDHPDATTLAPFEAGLPLFEMPGQKGANAVAALRQAVVLLERRRRLVETLERIQLVAVVGREPVADEVERIGIHASPITFTTTRFLRRPSTPASKPCPH